MHAFRKGVLVAALDRRPLHGVRPWPQLFTQEYLARTAGGIVRLASTPTSLLIASKDKWLFAAWETVYPHFDRSASCRDRTSARVWVTQHANDSWVSASVVSATEYWRVLKRHRFIISPSGLGVQSPKTYEAILAGALPICHHDNVAYRTLRDEGWPIVIVKDWTEINEAALSAWWEVMSPRLGAARRCLLRPTFSQWAIRRGQRIADCMRHESGGT